MKGFFYENTINTSAIDKNVKSVCAILQAAVDEFNAIAAAPLVDLAELRSLFKESGASRTYMPDAARALLIDRIIDLTPALKALRATVSNEALRAMVDASKLQDLTSLNNAMNRVADYQPGAGFRDLVAWEAYKLDGATVTIQADQVESLKEPHRERATTDIQRARLAASRNVCDAMNALFVLTEGIEPAELTIAGVTIWQGSQFMPSPRFVMYGKAGALTIADFPGSKPRGDAMRSTPPAPEADEADDTARGARFAKLRNAAGGG